MAIIDLHSWPSPVDDNGVGVVILTERTLFHALGAAPSAVEALDPAAATGESIRAILSTNAFEIPREEVRDLVLVRGESRFRIRTSDGCRTVFFRGEATDTARETFDSLRHSLGFESVREARGNRWKSAKTPLLLGLLVLFTGAYLVSLAGLGADGDAAATFLAPAFLCQLANSLGMETLGLVMAAGLIPCAVWAGHRLSHPFDTMTATRAPRRASHDPHPLPGSEEKIRTATAALLGVEPAALRPEARFVEDLRIPPGELSEVLAELAADLQVEISRREIHTFADLLRALTR